jgi:DNA modification methylase
MTEPYVADRDFLLYVGDVLDVLRELDAASVDCVVTSPPYWGLRDYGTGTWAGGDADCDHKQRANQDHDGGGSAFRSGRYVSQGEKASPTCKCGAARVDRQLGLEASPDEYLAAIVEVFREVRRVLAPHGTCWVNLGDAYASSGERVHGGFNGSTPTAQRTKGERLGAPMQLAGSGIKTKDLCGIPWRVAFALQADGWYLRADIVWAKPNPMPESVTDRPTKAHEYVFLLTKQPRYFFDQEAVREPAEWARWGDQTNGKHEGEPTGAGWIGAKSKEQLQGGRHARHYSAENFKTTDERNTRYQGPNPADGGRNLRSVWSIATQPYAEAHFATFPEALPERCIAAGCPEWVCRTCGKPRESNCGHDDYRPGVVLDPFMGSGTVALVARKLGRQSIGIELNAEYAALCARRLNQLSLLADAQMSLLAEVT